MEIKIEPEVIAQLLGLFAQMAKIESDYRTRRLEFELQDREQAIKEREQAMKFKANQELRDDALFQIKLRREQDQYDREVRREREAEEREKEERLKATLRG